MPAVRVGTPALRRRRMRERSVTEDSGTDRAGRSDVVRGLLVDDHALFRRGLRVTLELEPDMVVVGESGDGADAVAKAIETLPDVVLMDVQMPRRGGIEACSAIKTAAPSTKILMLTMSDDEGDLYEAIRSGASGYLLKDLPVDEVASSIRAVQTGQSLISPALAAKLLTEFAALAKRGESPQAAPTPRLTGRDGGASAGRPRDEQPRHRPRAVHQREHGQEPRPQHAGEAAASLTDGGRRLRRAGEADRDHLTPMSARRHQAVPSLVRASAGRGRQPHPGDALELEAGSGRHLPGGGVGRGGAQFEPGDPGPGERPLRHQPNRAGGKPAPPPAGTQAIADLGYPEGGHGHPQSERAGAVTGG